MSVKVEGLSKLVAQLKEHERSLARGTSKGIKNAGKFALQKSQEIVPTDDGDLEKSGSAQVTGKGFETVSAVGYSEEYAVEVHEDLEVTHGQEYNLLHASDITQQRKYFYKGRFKAYHLRRPHEQAKFLEDAVRQNLDEIEGIIRHGVFSELKR
jgi:hypothetical protein